MRILVLFLFFFSFHGGANAEKLPKGRISNLSEPNKFFTGRKSEISAVSDSLVRNNTLVIEGVSGIGKTQLAKQYAHTHVNNYDLIWWFDSKKNMDTQTDELLREIFRRENKPYYRPVTSLGLAAKFKETLSFLHASWLIVLDNIEDTSAISHYLPLKNTDSFSKHVIVTSKKMNETYASLNIQKFQREESIDFLSKILDGESKESLNQLAEALGDYPLALAQAAGYIKMNPSINVKTYLELFKEGRSELWNAEEKIEQGEKVKDNYNKTIGTAIKLNIEAIRHKSPLAYDLLCLCSFFHQHHIPLEALENWACNKRNASKLEFHEALSLLLNYFVLEKEKKAGGKKSSNLFTQHELIQLIIFDAVNKNARQPILNEAVDCIVHSLLRVPETLQEQFKGKEYFFNHFEKLCRIAEKLNHNNSKINALKIAKLYFVHFMQHDFAQSAQLIKSLRDLPKTDPNLDPLAQVWLHSTIVNDQMFEDFSQVQKNYDSTLKCLKKINDVETQRSYLLHVNTNYIESLGNFGRLQEAIALCDSLIDVSKASRNRSQKIAFLAVSGVARLKFGQYQLALNDISYCLDTVREQKELENYIPFFMVTKSLSLLYLGEVEKAYKIVEEYYPHLLEIFASPECMVIVTNQFVKGACLATFGKLDEALDVVQTSLSAYERSSGFGNDSLKGMGYRILGEIYEARDDLITAAEKYAKAENFYDSILQEKTLDELGLLYTRLALLGAKLGDDLMVKKYLCLHIENFGLAHPRTFEIKKFLDERGLPLL